MNFKLTATLAALLLVIVGLMMYLSSRPEKPVDTDPAAALFKPKPTGIKEITLTRDGATVLAFARPEGKWSLTQPVAAPVESWQLESIADSLTALTYKDKFKPDTNRPLANIGLDKPRTVLTFVDGAGKTYTLYVGKRTPAKTIYVKKDGEESVYELDQDFFEKLDKDPSDFRSKDLVDLTPADVQRITLAHPDQTVEITRQDGKWVITKPITARANQSAVEEIVNEVRTTRAQSFTEIKKTSPATGLAKPLLSITLHTQAAATQPATQSTSQTASTQPSKDKTVQYGNYTDLTKKSQYISLAGSNESFIATADAFKKVDKQLFDLRDPSITPAAVSDASAVTITGEHPLTLTKTNGNWEFTAGKSAALPADATAVSNLLTSIKNLRVNQFLDSAGDLKSLGLAPAAKTITLTLPGKTDQETILIGQPQKAEPLTPVMRQGEPTVYLVQTPDVEKLNVDLLALRDKAVAKLPANDIQTITINGQGREAPLTLTKTGTTWQLESAGKKTAADAEKVSALLADLDPVTATAFISDKPLTGTPAITVTLTYNDTTAPATTQTAGPMPAKTETKTLTLTHKDKAWQASFTTDWTFTPTPDLVEKLQKETYEPATTQPAK